MIKTDRYINEVKLLKNKDKNKLYLYGQIRSANRYDDPENHRGFISAEDVVNALDDISGPLEVHINSGGGAAFESIAISNRIKEYEKSNEVVVYVDGIAGSGASIICAGAKNVRMYKNATQMIHGSLSSAFGHAKDLRDEADRLESLDNAIKETYMAKFVGTKEELTAVMDKEGFLTAEQCLAFGLCSEIIEETDPKNKDNEDIVLSLFKKYKSEDEAKGDKSLFKKFINKGE